jgi:deoxyribodipyrimidine photo-lyase
MFPGMVRAAAGQVPVRLEQVDGNGLLPLRVSDRAFPTAYAFRRHHQKMLPEHLEHRPRGNPLARTNLPEPVRLPRAITRRWPPATPDVLAGKSLHRLPIDHAVPPVVDVPGGEAAAGRALRRFLERGLNRYAADHHRPQEPASSGLSPYLHFGHVSAHEVFDALARRESWDPGKLSRKTDGKQTGRWGMSAGAESFLNQLVTWRELGYTMTFHRGDYAEYASLPTWARRTLEAHAGDTRPHLYGLEEFESGRTHDPLWNAAQGELVVKGRIHNYLRMLWGKKILEWSSSPRAALAVMIELNNKYGLDGRNPNSYSGIFWVLGRYDRPWGPERPILGKIRYMSSRNTARKVRVSEYVATFAPSGGAAP